MLLSTAAVRPRDGLVGGVRAPQVGVVAVHEFLDVRLDDLAQALLARQSPVVRDLAEELAREEVRDKDGVC